MQELLPHFQNFIARCTETQREMLALPSTPSSEASFDFSETSDLGHSCSLDTEIVQGNCEAEMDLVNSPSGQLLSSTYFSTGSDLIVAQHSGIMQGAMTSSPWPSSGLFSGPLTPPMTVHSGDLQMALSPYPANNCSSPMREGPTGDWQVLVPECTMALSPYPPNDCTSPTPEQPIGAGAADTVSPKGVTETQAYFQSKLGARRSRSKYLVRAVAGLQECANLDPKRYDNLWSTQRKIFSTPGAEKTTRFEKLLVAFLNIKRAREDYDCASRLCHLFLDHDLEELLKSGGFRLSRGRGRKTAALLMQAERVSVNIEALKAHRKAGMAYLQLFLHVGPGVLLILGRQVNTM